MYGQTEDQKKRTIDRQRDVLRMREGDGVEKLKLREIAIKLGVTKARVSAIHKQALNNRAKGRL